jgi:hypothetical protein
VTCTTPARSERGPSGLACQIRQTTRSLRAENYARVRDRMSTLQSRLSADNELNHLVAVGAERRVT